MWLDKLQEEKKRTNMSSKNIAEQSGLPEKTVIRVLSGKTQNPYIDTLSRIATAIGCTLTDILADTKAVVGTEPMTEMQSTIDELTAERDFILAQNTMLTDKVTALASEVELLKMQLSHKEELLAVHNYYIMQGKK